MEGRTALTTLTPELHERSTRPSNRVSLLTVDASVFPLACSLVRSFVRSKRKRLELGIGLLLLFGR